MLGYCRKESTADGKNHLYHQLRTLIRTFQYKNNSTNLVHGSIAVGLVALLIYKAEVRYDVRGIYLLWFALYGLVTLFMIWVAIVSFKTFFRLNGQKRLLVVDDQSITFPEHGDSLNIIRLSFSQIRDIYFGKNRRGGPDNLIIKYDIDGHAYIQRDALDKHDFDEICELIKLRLGIDEIGVR